MFNKENVVKAWTDCCSRTLPTADTVLASVVDPTHVEQGVRASLYQPQVDAAVKAITDVIKAENKKTLDKLDSLISAVKNQTTDININQISQADKIVKAIKDLPHGGGA